MAEKWIDIFDLSTAAGRLKEKEMDQIVNNYDPNFLAAPVTIGHFSDYLRSKKLEFAEKVDSRVPAAAWVEKLRRVGHKIQALLRFPEELKVAIPPEFKEVFGMPKLLKELLDKKYYRKPSIGLRNYNGELRLHHLAVLGAQVPQCKGLADIELKEHPEYKDYILEFSDESNEPITLIEFQAMDELLQILAQMYGLESTATEEEILGAVKAEKAEMDQAKEDAAAIANQGIFMPAVGSPEYKEFQEKFGKAVIAYTEKLSKPAQDKANALIAKLEAKMKEFAEATPPPPATPPATPPAVVIESLNLDDAGQQAKADTAKSDLTAKKNWIGAWDEKWYPDFFKLLSNVKYKDGSALDMLVEGLSAVNGLNEMSELITSLSKTIDLDEFKELDEQSKKTTVRQPVPTHAKEHVENQEVYQKIMEFAEANPDKDGKALAYDVATERMMAQGKI